MKTGIGLYAKEEFLRDIFSADSQLLWFLGDSIYTCNVMKSAMAANAGITG